jgi:uncharacterized membrane protein
MAHRINRITKNKSGQVISWLIVILSILGAIDALYLLIYKLTGINQMCLGNGGCHNVNFSSYSEIYGIPVSALGLVAYLVIMVIIILESRIRLAQENGPLAVFGISLIGVAFSAYLTYLEFYVIHAVCPFCITSAIVITLIFILAIIRLVKQTAS